MLDTSPWHHRQKPAPLSIVTFILFGAICGIAGFGLGSYLVDREAHQAIELFDQLLVEKGVLNKQLEEVKQAQSILESGSKVDRLSVEKTQAKLAELDVNLSETKEKLAFYQRIMAPEKSNEALYIQGFRLIPIAKANQYKFMLTLAQGVGKKRAIKGSVILLVKGRLAGETKELKLNEVTTEKKASLPFSFRYFQTFGRDLVLPDNFSPESLVIKLKPSTKRAGVVEKRWDWKELIDVAE